MLYPTEIKQNAIKCGFFLSCQVFRKPERSPFLVLLSRKLPTDYIRKEKANES